MRGVNFQAIDSSSGLRVADTVGQERSELLFPDPTDWTHTDTREFPFPVSEAVEATVSGFGLEPFSSMYVRDTTGDAFLAITPGDQQTLPDHEYCFELCTPVKLYILLSGSGDISASQNGIEVEFDSPQAVKIGARSPRTIPRATVTTTHEPTDIMRAISCFGSSIQTTSPTRSYATTRGYPPLLELGAELSIPDGIQPDDSQVSFELPPRLEYIFPATSLTYYLNASLETGDEPRLRVDGDVVSAAGSMDYHAYVEQLLQRIFFLDSLTRTVGHYPFATHAYQELVDDLSFDVGDVYDASPGSRLESYLSVPYETIEPELPVWSLTAHMEPEPEHCPSLPHLARQLAFIRTGQFDRISGMSARQKGMQSFMAHYDSRPTRIAQDVFDSDAAFVELSPSTETEIDVWVGSDTPLQANEFRQAGYENRLNREPVDRSTITVSIICNEFWMDGEVDVSKQRYEDRQELPFDIDVYEHLTRDEVRTILESEVDFIHYIGHANKEGLKCSDGYFDVDSVTRVGADMFFLNACQSYRPGIDMIRNGCLGGIVTLSEVTDDEAATVGRTVARLLNLGFPLRNALQIVRRRSIIGGQYLAIGDDSASMVQAESGTPYECSVTGSGGEYELTLRTYPTNRFHLGSLFRPNVDSDPEYYLAGKEMGPYCLTRDDLVTFLELENAPVEFNGDFRWAFDLAADLR